MRLIGTIAGVLAGALALGDLTVVTTTTDLASIAKSVGGSRVSVSSIVTGVRDPHFIDAKPSYMSRLRGADLFIAVGLDLEVGYELALIQGSRNPKIAKGKPGHLYASDGVAVLEVPTRAISRAQGDVHPYGNPHIWLDPYNARIIARSIADRMGQLDPSNRSGYRSRAEAFVRSVDVAMFGSAAVQANDPEQLWTWSSVGNLAARLRAKGTQLGGWAATMEPHRDKPIVTYHKSYNYFAKRFGLRVVEQLEPIPGIPPTPGHVSDVVETIQSQGAKLIMQEGFYSKRAAERVASRTGAAVVVVPQSVGQAPSVDDYVSLIGTIVDLVSGVLSG